MTDSFVTFSQFTDLLGKIALLSPSTVNTRPPQPFQPRTIFRRWRKSLVAPIDPRVGPAVFRMLFPEEDTRRYSVREPTLARLICRAFGHPPQSLAQLLNWSKQRGETGCFGMELYKISHLRERSQSLSLIEVNDLLSELASLSPYNDISVDSASTRSALDIIRSIFGWAGPWEAACLSQIILRDLRPLLYPTITSHPTTSLLGFNGLAYSRLTLNDALREWDMHLLKVHSRYSKLNEALEALALQPDQSAIEVKCTLGCPVTIPKCHKGRSLAGIMRYYREEKGSVFAEIKYDGERAQIHVDFTQHHEPRVRIFSKSRKDSTEDRVQCIPIVHAALGFQDKPRIVSPSIQSIIVEAEMVAYSKELDGIDEFWRIRSLIESTSHGPRRLMKRTRTSPASQSSIFSDASDNGQRHLALVFFDILHMNGQDLLDSPYEERRRLLESVIIPNAGRAMLAERSIIKSPQISWEDAELCLNDCLSQCIASSQEGLVIKASSSLYGDRKLPWIKLKKDYIPGHGDAVDLVCFGASWTATRGHELLVGPDVLTDFYVGSIGSTSVSARAQFKGVFVVSYGLGRAELEAFNYQISSRLCAKPCGQVRALVPYQFELSVGLREPSVIWEIPILVEVFGAGFTKSPGCKQYQLRHPRLSKIYRPEERSWQEALSTPALHEIALKALGRLSRKSVICKDVQHMWGQLPPRSSLSSSPQVIGSSVSRALETSRIRVIDDLTGLNLGAAVVYCQQQESNIPNLRRVSTLEALFTAVGWLSNLGSSHSRFHGGDVSFGIIMCHSDSLRVLKLSSEELLNALVSQEGIKPLYLIAI